MRRKLKITVTTRRRITGDLRSDSVVDATTDNTGPADERLRDLPSWLRSGIRPIIGTAEQSDAEREEVGNI